jgi:hypothetical protein
MASLIPNHAHYPKLRCTRPRQGAKTLGPGGVSRDQRQTQLGVCNARRAQPRKGERAAMDNPIRLCIKARLYWPRIKHLT